MTELYSTTKNVFPAIASVELTTVFTTKHAIA